MDKQLPLYQCFKQVRAAKIAHIQPSKPVNASQPGIASAWTMFFTDAELPPVSVTDAVYQKHSPREGWYLIRYEDGYLSFSPANTFESGYARIDTEGGATALKAAHLAQQAAEAETLKIRQEAAAERKQLHEHISNANARIQALLSQAREQ